MHGVESTCIRVMTYLHIRNIEVRIYSTFCFRINLVTECISVNKVWYLDVNLDAW